VVSSVFSSYKKLRPSSVGPCVQLDLSSRGGTNQICFGRRFVLSSVQAKHDRIVAVGPWAGRPSRRRPCPKLLADHATLPRSMSYSN
jgi:hypothetical protein